MPQFEDIKLPSGRRIIRFSDLESLFFYDVLKNNPTGLGMRGLEDGSYGLEKLYLENRVKITPSKQRILDEAQRDIKLDKDFLNLVYKAKADKREYKLNKHGGNLSMPQYASNAEKIFKQGKPGAKKQTLNIAFQVGTFVGHNYEDAFIRIVKTVLMCQAMNIALNIDVFDSDKSAIKGGGYVICNVIKSSEKINYRKLLACSHPEFFNGSLFNGYSASGNHDYIGGFLEESEIIKDLSPFYDVIGGNLVLDKKADNEKQKMVSSILKISIDGIRT